MKKETIEEVAENYAKQFDYAEDSSPQIDFMEGAKWQQEQDKKLYSEEEVRHIAEWSFHFYKTNEFSDSELEDEWELRLNKMFKDKTT
jgi:hypothetical protein